MEGHGPFAAVLNRLAPWFFLLGLVSLGIAAFSGERGAWLWILGTAWFALAMFATSRASR
jgi:hypothetical protein